MLEKMGWKRSKSPKRTERVAGRQSPNSHQAMIQQHLGQSGQNNSGFFTSSPPQPFIHHQGSLPLQGNSPQVLLPSRGTFPQPVVKQPRFSAAQDVMAFKATSSTSLASSGINPGRAFFDYTLQLNKLIKTHPKDWPFPPEESKVDVLMNMHDTYHTLHAQGKNDTSAFQGLAKHAPDYDHGRIQQSLGWALNTEIANMVDQGKVTPKQAQKFLDAESLDHKESPINLNRAGLKQDLLNIASGDMQYRSHDDNIKAIQTGIKGIQGVNKARQNPRYDPSDEHNMSKIEDQSLNLINSALIGMMKRHDGTKDKVSLEQYHTIHKELSNSGIQLSIVVNEQLSRMKKEALPLPARSSGATPSSTSSQFTSRKEVNPQLRPSVSQNFVQTSPTASNTYVAPHQVQQNIPRFEQSHRQQQMVMGLGIIQDQSSGITTSPIMPSTMASSSVPSPQSSPKPELNKKEEFLYPSHAISFKATPENIKSMDVEKSVSNLMTHYSELLNEKDMDKWPLPEKEIGKTQKQKADILLNMSNTLMEVFMELEDVNPSRAKNLEWSQQQLLDQLRERTQQESSKEYQSQDEAKKARSSSFNQGPMEHIPTFAPTDTENEHTIQTPVQTDRVDSFDVEDKTPRVSEGQHFQPQAPKQQQPLNSRDEWKIGTNW